jgi:hypothetical protein
MYVLVEGIGDLLPIEAASIYFGAPVGTYTLERHK